MTSWIVYSSRSSYTVEVLEIIERRGDTVAAVVDNLDDGPVPVADVVTIRPHDLGATDLVLPGVVPLITPAHRAAVFEEASRLGLTRFPVLADPTAVIARSARLADGCVVNALAVVGGGAELGRFVHVNRSASIGHHALIEEFATVGPGAVLAGSVSIGRGAFVGAGAVCAPEVRVGAGSVVGTGAVVVRDVPDHVTVAGNPARVIREATPGYGGVALP